MWGDTRMGLSTIVGGVESYILKNMGRRLKEIIFAMAAQARYSSARIVEK